ncbi:hypothetical protein [Cupriavidus sp. H18C1]|uniref:hypothetical protein n=1 Tax=Cupriavidus sp. H18C1 TaxID=3241601 RepID=UPI003BB85D7C
MIGPIHGHGAAKQHEYLLQRRVRQIGAALDAVGDRQAGHAIARQRQAGAAQALAYRGATAPFDSRDQCAP